VADVYQSQPISSAPNQEGIVVIHCSDPRYLPHFEDFLRKGLGLERYALLAIPGGPQTLTLSDYLPKFAWSGWRWMKFLVNLTKPQRLVLIQHDDCRWYLENHFAEADRVRARQIEDLRRVRDAFYERHGDLRCDLFYARLEGSSARFERIDGQPRATS
jgi:hypothetical protein